MILDHHHRSKKTFNEEKLRKLDAHGLYWGLNRAFPLSPRGVDRLCVIQSDLEESHDTRVPPTDEFETGAAWSRLIDYRIARHCLTTGWSGIVPSHGFSVKKRTNHDGVGCYSNMAARQCAALRRDGKGGKVSLPVMPFSGSPLRPGNVYPGLIRSTLPCHGLSQGCISPWHSPESSPDLATLPLVPKTAPIAPIAFVVISVAMGIGLTRCHFSFFCSGIEIIMYIIRKSKNVRRPTYIDIWIGKTWIRGCDLF